LKERTAGVIHHVQRPCDPEIIDTILAAAEVLAQMGQFESSEMAERPSQPNNPVDATEVSNRSGANGRQLGLPDEKS